MKENFFLDPFWGFLQIIPVYPYLPVLKVIGSLVIKPNIPMNSADSIMNPIMALPCSTAMEPCLLS